MLKWMAGIAVLAILILALPGAAGAQEPVACAHTYVVKPGDWLANVAARYYDNPWAYPTIVFATNNKVSHGDGFQIISDPYLIEPGWVLCIPASETAMGAVGVDTLRNTVYRSDWTREGTAPLADGEYSEPAAPGSAIKTVVKLHDRLAFGYMADGQQLAAAVLVTDPGGSGTFYDLAAIVFKDGEPQHVASALLGDRVQLRSLAIENGEIVVEMIAQGPNDPMCCPTQRVVKWYALQGQELVPVSSEAQPDLDLAVGGIRLDMQGLYPSWEAVVVPEKPYDQSMPPGPVGLPAHGEILFGATGLADRQSGDPILYIIPVNAYQQMWDKVGNAAVADTLKQIAARTSVTNLPGSVAALPFEEIVGRIDLAAQIGRAAPFGQLNVTSAAQSGYRFVGRWAQDANPVTNHNLTYVYQGFTNDGGYLVSFFYPVSTAALPAMAEISQKEMDRLKSDYEAYMAEKTALLDGLDSADFAPNLATLDALVASLEIDGMPVSGLQGKTWQWTSGPAQPGSSEIITIEHPELYQVTYTLAGTVEIVADCNRASLSYELRQGGLIGGMLAMPGPMSLAECGPGSHSQGFVFSLQAAQNYRVHPGGNHLSLILPAGGGTLTLESAP